MHTGERLPAKCLRTDEFGTPATCTKVGDEWVVSFEDGVGAGMGTGIPSGFAALFVIAILAGLAVTAWKISTARRMARESGMDERDATTMTLLTDDGFEATYLASNLRGQTPAPAPSTAARASTADRLSELRTLHERGLIDDAEHAAARQRILDGL